MKNFARAALFLALTSNAFGYQEHIVRDGDKLFGSWTSSDDASLRSAHAPIAGNFYAFDGTILSSDMNCDQVAAKVRGLTSDWHLFPHINLYALTYCTVPTNGKSQTDFIYAIDAWTPDAVPIIQTFLKAHEGIQFLDQTLQFYAVTGIDVNTIQSLGILTGTSLKVVHSAQNSQPYSGTDQWWPDYNSRANLVQQTDESKFLDYIMQKFGFAEVPAFQRALTTANFVFFTDAFTLHLSNGQTVDFWLGFGGTRQCKTGPCFTNGPSLN